MLRSTWLLALLCAPALAQAPLVDLNPVGQPLDGYAEPSVEAGQVVRGNQVFLSAWTPATGRELYVAQIGQPAKLVADLRPGAIGARPELGGLIGSSVYFAADDGKSGRELWRSDGTVAGTQLVHDLAPGAASAEVEQVTPFNGGVAFVAAAVSGDREVWWTDGTAGGLVQLSNLSVGGFQTSIKALHASSTHLFFAALEPLTGYEVHASDGTAGSAVLLADMAPGIQSADPDNYFEYNGRTFIKVLSVATQDAELWGSDGTPGGTQLVRLLGPAFLPEPWTIGEMVELNGKLVFTAMTDPEGAEIWMTDGTPGGTQVLTDFNPPGFWPPPIRLQVLGGEVLFTMAGASPGGPPELWKCTTQFGSAQLVADLHPTAASFPEQFTPHAGRVFFTAESGRSATGRELWSTNGTTAGTQLEGDLWPGGESGEPLALVSTPPGLVFSARAPGVGRELFRWTAAGAGLLADVAPGMATGDSDPRELTRVFATDLLWAADDGVRGLEPYIARDGQAVASLGDLNPFGASAPRDFTGLVRGGAEVVFFTADDGQHGRELWRVDATGVQLFADVVAGGVGSDPTSLTAVGGELFFVALGPGGIRELWRTEGAGVKSLTTTVVPGGTDPDSLTPLGSNLYFIGVDSIGRRNLFATNGTGVVQMTQHTLPPDVRPVGLTALAGKLAFLWPVNAGGDVELRVLDPVTGLFVSHATSQSVQVPWNDAVDPGFRPATYGSRYAFYGRHASLHDAVLSVDVDSGAQALLFAPDAGQPSASFGVVRELTWVDETLYFAGGGTQGDELYRVAPGALGKLVFDPTKAGASGPTNLTAVGDDLYFSVAASDDVELVGDVLRTKGGVVEVAVDLTSIANGGAGAPVDPAPQAFAVVGSDLMFAATVASGTGREVYRLAAPGAVSVDYGVDGSSGSAGQLSLSAPVLGRQLKLRFDNLNPTTVALVLFSAAPKVPIVGLTAPGDVLWVAPASVQLGPVNLMGEMDLNLSVTSNPSLAGLQFAVQVMTATPAFYLRTSNALLVTVGQ